MAATASVVIRRKHKHSQIYFPDPANQLAVDDDIVAQDDAGSFWTGTVTHRNAVTMFVVLFLKCTAVAPGVSRGNPPAAGVLYVIADPDGSSISMAADVIYADYSPGADNP